MQEVVPDSCTYNTTHFLTLYTQIGIEIMLCNNYNCVLRRKKAKIEGNNYNCVLCSQNREKTAFHLFFSCPFSKACCNHLNIN
jgi:hypothetical protein